MYASSLTRDSTVTAVESEQVRAKLGSGSNLAEPNKSRLLPNFIDDVYLPVSPLRFLRESGFADATSSQLSKIESKLTKKRASHPHLQVYLNWWGYLGNKTSGAISLVGYISVNLSSVSTQIFLAISGGVEGMGGLRCTFVMKERLMRIFFRPTVEKGN
ncbi:hypothetical protein BT96DRAFT_949572 [Gymnopus androsaceus JB14]|uniref:Uncharacterized protein n=1 Tax=Gymnopus androsaceus JB14 TaxID=1447944 RepID=A0A6A4GK72_9AGAR|nr:hypothetical protein BT96DRAFT_949572 [Gymnopus androsaceus JB14]